MRSHILVSLIAAVAVLAAPSSAVALCPTSPFDVCLQDGFCVVLDVESSRHPESDRPAQAVAESPDPTQAMQDSRIGSGDFSGAAEAAGIAGRGLLVAGGDISADSPGPSNTPGEPLKDATAIGSARTLFRASDLVFTGPGPEVETSLHLHLDGLFSATAIGIENKETLANVLLGVGGAICEDDPNGVDFSFFGARSYRAFNNSDNVNFDGYQSSQGILAGVPLDEVTDFTVGPFMVPTGTPLEIEIRADSNLTAITGGGLAQVSAKFEFKLAGSEGGAVFDLPAGYTVDSATAGVVDNGLGGGPGPTSCSPFCTTLSGKDELLVKRVAKLNGKVDFDLDLKDDGSFSAKVGDTELEGSWTSKKARKYKLQLDAPSLEAWLTALEDRAEAKKGKPVALEARKGASLSLELNKKGTKASLEGKFSLKGNREGKKARKGDYRFKLKGASR